MTYLVRRLNIFSGTSERLQGEGDADVPEQVRRGTDHLDLREHEAEATIGEVCQRHGVSDATFYTWRNQYSSAFLMIAVIAPTTTPAFTDTRRTSKHVEGCVPSMQRSDGPSLRKIAYLQSNKPTFPRCSGNRLHVPNVVPRPAWLSLIEFTTSAARVHL
jgi:hypothetical protein